jgi:CheY-like chemotaxis protein
MNDTREAARAAILIVDDTPANLELLTQMLSQQGHRVRVAADGLSALESARANPPDLVLLDIRMPGLNGYQVCEQLKADAPTRAIPVIFLSALNETADKIKAFSVGGVDYITKPFQAAEVLARVHTHLQLRQVEELKREAAERQRAEAALQTSERRFRALIENSFDAITLLDAACTIVYESPASVKVTGYPVGEQIGRRGFDVIHPDDVGTAQQAYEQLMRAPGQTISMRVYSQ